MITSAENEEARRTSSTNQILLTLRKNPNSCHVNAVFKRIGSNRAANIPNGKMIEINAKCWESGLKNCHSFSLKDIHSSVEPGSVDLMLPKITQISTNKKSTVNKQQTSILRNRLLSEKKFLQKCTSLLNGSQISRRFGRKPAKTKSDNLNEDNSGPSINKQNRFVPNILKYTKSDMELLTKMKKTNTISKDHKLVKRKRKQVLMSTEPEQNNLQRNQNLSAKTKLNQPLPNISDPDNLTEESDFSVIRMDASSKEYRNVDRTLESHTERSEAVEEGLITKSLDFNDSNKSNTKVSYSMENSPSEVETTCTDQSIRKILDEFKEPDYKNYIVSEDLCFHEMDKLLSSDNDDLLNVSPIFNDSNKMVEYDMNGNNVENYENAVEMNSNTKKWKTNNVQCYYNNEADPIDNTSESKLSINLDNPIFSNAPNQGENLIQSETEFWMNQSEDYSYPCDNIDGFQRNIKQLSSLLDTTCEFENNNVSSIKSVPTDLPREGNLEHSVTSLAAVSDILPHDVFSCGSNEAALHSFELDGDYAMKQPSDSGPAMEHNNILNESVQRFTTDFQLFSNFDTDPGFMEVAEYTADDNFNVESSLLSGNGTKDAKISAELESSDTFVNDYQYPFYAQLSSHELNTFENKSSLDLDSQFDTSVTSTPELGSSLLTYNEIKRTADNDLQVVYDLRSKVSYASDDEKFSYESEADTKKVERHFNNGNSDLFNSGNLLSRYVDCMESCSRCAPPYIVKRDLNKLNISELEALLARKKTLDDYSNAYFLSSVAQNGTSDMRLANNNNMQYFETWKHSGNKFYSQAKGYPEVIRFAPTISSCKNWQCKEYDCRNIEQTLHSRLPQGANISSDAASSNRQLYSYQMSSRMSQTSDNLPTNVKKSNRAALQSNRRKRSQNKELNITFVHCGFCKKKYPTAKELVEHLGTEHNRQDAHYTHRRKKYACEKCSKEYCFPGAVKKHLKLHENYSLTCRRCGKHFSERRFLTFHAYNYHYIRQFICSYCSQKFHKSNDLTRHLKQCYDLR